MNIKTKLIISAALVALLSAPASARIDGDDSHAAAYPNGQRTYTTDAASAYASGNPVPVQRQQRLRQSQPQR